MINNSSNFHFNIIIFYIVDQLIIITNEVLSKFNDI